MGGMDNTKHTAMSALTYTEQMQTAQQTVHGKKTSNFLLVANYNEEDVIINIHNCILTVKGYFEGLMPTYSPEHNDCEEKEPGVVHIGSWQFARDTHENTQDMRSVNSDGSINGQLDVKAAETQAIIKELELEVWVHWKHKPKCEVGKAFATQLTDEAQPYWLTAEQESAVQAHSKIRQIFDLCNSLHEEYKKQPKSKMLLKVSIQELYKGSIDFDVFMRNIQSVMNLPAKPARIEDDESSTSSHTDKKAIKSRFSLFPFVMGSSAHGVGAQGNSNALGESTHGKRGNMISFNLPGLGMGGGTRNDEDSSPLSNFLARTISGTGHANGVANGSGDAEGDDSTHKTGGMSVSSRLTQGAMTIGAAALSLPSSLAYSITHQARHSDSPVPAERSNTSANTGGTGSVGSGGSGNSGERSASNGKTAMSPLDTVLEEDDHDRSYTHVPFGASPINTNSSIESMSWDTETPIGMEDSKKFFGREYKKSEKRDATAAAEKPEKSALPNPDEFAPTVVSPQPMSPLSEASFTYADLKPTRRRHSSPRLGAKNSVRWSTGNLNDSQENMVGEELATIDEGNEQPSKRSKSGSVDTTSDADAGDTVDVAVPLTPPPTSRVKRLGSQDSDDDALFFDAQSPNELIRKASINFSEFSQDEIGPSPIPSASWLLPDTIGSAAGSAEGAQKNDIFSHTTPTGSPSGSPSATPRTPTQHDDGAGDNAAAESGDDAVSNLSNVSNGSAVSVDIAGINPMYTFSPATATLLASDAHMRDVHPLRRANSFGRKRPSADQAKFEAALSGLEGTNSNNTSARFFSPIGDAR